MCFVVTCWERADLLALVCGVLLWVYHFPIGILGQVWYLIVSNPDLCTLTTFVTRQPQKIVKFLTDLLNMVDMIINNHILWLEVIKIKEDMS